MTISPRGIGELSFIGVSYRRSKSDFILALALCWAWVSNFPQSPLILPEEYSTPTAWDHGSIPSFTVGHSSVHARGEIFDITI